MIIFRYFIREIFASTFASSLVLMLIFISNRLAHYLSDAASGKITLDAVMMVMLLQVPYLLGFILPLALFLGIMLSLGRFYVDHEMVALSACGFSKTRLIGTIMLIATIIMGLVGWLTLQLEPEIFRYRTQIVVHSVASMSLKKVVPGRFQRLRDDTSALYVGKIASGEKKYQDIFVAMQQKPKPGMSAPYAWNVLSASQINEESAPHKGTYFAFTNGSNYNGRAGSNDFNIITFDKQFVRQPPIPVVTFEGRYQLMSNSELFDLYSTDAHAMAELQWRITWTLSTLILAFLAIPLSRVDPRLGRFSQLLPAILIYVVFLNLMFVSKSWLKDGKVGRFFGMWWVDAGLFLLALLVYLHQFGYKRFYYFLRGKI